MLFAPMTNGVEFWHAGELMSILQYSNWQNFEKIIDKAKISYKNIVETAEKK